MMAYPDTAWHENTPVICPVARLDTRGHGLPQNQKRTKVSKCAKFVGLFFYFGQRVHQISTRGECLIGKLFKVGMGVGPSIQTRVYGNGLKSKKDGFSQDPTPGLVGQPLQARIR